jgi:hypothetical protein
MLVLDLPWVYHYPKAVLWVLFEACHVLLAVQESLDSSESELASGFGGTPDTAVSAGQAWQRASALLRLTHALLCAVLCCNPRHLPCPHGHV